MLDRNSSVAPGVVSFLIIDQRLSLLTISSWVLRKDIFHWMFSSDMGVFLYVEVFLVGVSDHPDVLVHGEAACMGSAGHAIEDMPSFQVVVANDEQPDRTPGGVAPFCASGVDSLLAWPELATGYASIHLGKAFHRGCVAAAFALGQLEAHRFFAPVLPLDMVAASLADVTAPAEALTVTIWGKIICPAGVNVTISECSYSVKVVCQKGLKNQYPYSLLPNLYINYIDCLL